MTPPPLYMTPLIPLISPSYSPHPSLFLLHRRAKGLNFMFMLCCFYIQTQAITYGKVVTQTLTETQQTGSDVAMQAEITAAGVFAVTVKWLKQHNFATVFLNTLVRWILYCSKTYSQHSFISGCSLFRCTLSLDIYLVKRFLNVCKVGLMSSLLQKYSPSQQFGDCVVLFCLF